MTTVAVLIPTTGRAEQMRRNVSALTAQDVEGVDVIAVLSVPIDDIETMAAAEQVPGNTLIVKRQPHTTAVQGWNQAYKMAADADWYVLGADDVVWVDGWLAEALRVAAQTGAQVIGLNDGGHTNIDDYAPHFIASRQFCEEHNGGYIAPPEYQSWWFDREMCQRARKLGLYAAAWGAVAEHLHPDWKTAEIDDTHRMAAHLHDIDRVLYERRRV